MALPVPPLIECDQIHTALAVPDLAAAIDYYVKKLGFTLAFTYGDPPEFAGVNLGHVQLFLDRATPNPNPDTAAAFFTVADADALYEFHRATKVDIVRPIEDRPYGMRDYTVRDLNGYYIVFSQHMLNAGPSIPIERVHVPVRLEKRLAALLADLAAHKRMSITSCLEEMILHTNEGVGPHTKATLRHIQDLKQKYGIDYDCHASYLFVETAKESGPLSPDH